MLNDNYGEYSMTAMITKDGLYWEPTQEQVISWERTYQNADVHRELRVMAQWLQDNQSRRKTLKGMTRFVNNWLNKADEKHGSPWARKDQQDREARGVRSTRDVPFSEFLTDRSWAEYLDTFTHRH